MCGWQEQCNCDPEEEAIYARVRDEQFHTILHCNCMPRLQPLAKSLGERSAVVCLLYCLLVSLVPLCPLVSSVSLRWRH